MTKLEYKVTEGAGGGKSGGGGGGAEANDTLVTDEMVKILHLIGEGEVDLYTGDGKSIFLNSVPLVNSNGSYNFGNYNQSTGDTGLYTGGGATYWEYRNGTPSQTPMTNPAFPSASNVISVNAQFTGGTSVPLVAPSFVIYSVSSALIDYCKVAIQFPNGLENLDSNGNIIGDSVAITIDVKPHSSSSWVNVITRTINDKSSTAAVIQFQVNNPSPGTLWDIRVGRVTPDNSSATRKNQTYLYTVEEVQKITLPYNGIAYCGVALDARTIGGTNASIPVMSFLVKKGPISIPSNFNPATNTFTGLWDGTFTTGVTDDPAWILYDLLTNSHYGCGLYGITASMIDKYSFYNASVFNNQQVPSGITGQTEPRFTFNASLQNRQDMLVTLNQIAGMMNATLGQTSGLIELFQDRPVTTPQYLITKCNVIPNSGVYFSYKATSKTNRTTAVNVTWTNAADPRYLPKTSSVTDSTGLSRYGYQPYDLAAFGATTEGQAIRAGRYWLYQNLYATEEVEFTCGLPGFLYNINDVFDLFDDDYAATAVSGRVVSATASTVTLDQAVTISASTSKIGVLLPDGVTYETHTITNSPGTYTNLTISGIWSVTPTQYCVYGVSSAVLPRQFKMTDLKYDGIAKTVTCTAQVYNSNNYSYVSTGVAIPAATYTLPSQLAPGAPTALASIATQYINPVNNQLSYGVTITWTPPTSQNIAYIVKWRKDNGQYNTAAQTRTASFELTNIVDGVYNFLVYSVNLVGNISAPAAISYTLNTTGGGSSTTLTDVSAVTVVGGGTGWTGFDLGVTWTNPTANQGLLKDFVVTFSTTGSVQLRQVVVPAVVGGAAQSYLYTFAMNQADGGGSPNRSVVVNVQCRDSQNHLTAGTSATLTNAAPAVPLNIASSPGLQSAIVTWAPETGVDVAGYLVWYSATSGFTPSSGNAIDCGNTAIASINALAKNTTYYYKVACYDVFGKSLSGTGLNLSSQLSFTTPSSVGIPSGSTLPTSGMLTGDTFFLTTTFTLYKYSGSVWIAVGIQTGSTLPTSGMNIGDVYFLTTTSKLYRYTSTGWTTVVDGADIVANSIAANSIVTGSLTTTQISSNTILGSNIAGGTITGSNIAGATITGGNIVAGTLTASLIAAGSITTTQIAANTITGGNIAGSTITGSNIVGGTITGSLVAANTITASNLYVSTLSAITANVGTLTAGTISNNSGTNTINLGATGSSAFISTPGLTITAAGTATFSGTLTASAINAVNTINIAGGAVTTLTTINQSSYYSFGNAMASGAIVVNPNCQGSFSLGYSANVIIICQQWFNINKFAVATTGNADGMFSVEINDTGAGYECIVQPLLKLDSTYYQSSSGIFSFNLAAGTHTVQLGAQWEPFNSLFAPPPYQSQGGGTIIIFAATR